MMSARMLADYFDQVTICERDQVEDRPTLHKSVPQGNHLHALLQGGQLVMSSLYPNFAEELERAGGVRWRLGTDLAFYFPDGKAYNITGPDAIGPRELVKLVSDITGKRIELVVLDDAAYRKYLLDNGTPETAIAGTLSFAAELNSPWLREPSTAVADLTGRPATSVRSLLLANKKRLLAAAK